jgi:hypothetical protein
MDMDKERTLKTHSGRKGCCSSSFTLSFIDFFIIVIFFFWCALLFGGLVLGSAKTTVRTKRKSDGKELEQRQMTNG